MHGLAYRRVLFKQRRVESTARETRPDVQAGGPAADDDDVVHRGHSTRPHSFPPRFSHVPRNVIQNDNAISLTSSQNDCRRIYNLS